MFERMTDSTTVPVNRRARFRREADAENDYLARLIAQIPEAVLCFDRNWVITYANAEAIRISRIQPADLHSKTYWELFPDTLGTELERVYHDVMHTRVSQQVEYFYEPLDMWVDIHILPTDDGISLYYRDITDRKNAEGLRDQAVSQLQQIFDSDADSIASIDRDWNCTFLNRRANELLGPKGELLGKSVWQEFPVAAQPGEILHHLHRAMDEAIPCEFEAFYPDPLNLWLSVQCRPFDDGIVLFFRDVTDRRQAETVLQEQQDLLASIQKTALVATWDVEYATGKTTYGAGSYPVFGHPLADISDYRSFKKNLLPEYIPIIAASIKTGVETGQMAGQDFQVQAADGRTLWLKSRRHPRMADAVPTHVRGLTIAITARKQNEEALVASYARY